MLKNTPTAYGSVAIVLHWLTALTVVGLFALGLWMVDLTYYDAWYQRGPDLHRSIGVLLAAVVILRLLWRLGNPRPTPLPSHRVWEQAVARGVHALFYILLLAMFASGYLITTAKGQGISVFDWFILPATITGIDNLEDIAGDVHEILAFTVIGLGAAHGLAALKHHFIDRDNTLLRMLVPRSLSDGSNGE
ncbi:cytochrome b [Exilibacterium tricleocarpae]|uniref:Cytochrome b n=1 Tax=Exilibacterium tricleocarpae TaxID=2591008 RepID=A0A545U5K1_9GAMM|nr:cytochrome b [Exilibacterium tricleocarpae]TQV84683.1 cytochrome b [Exilibacterium tricleocarpae]